jgi:hypothetical protein
LHLRIRENLVRIMDDHRPGDVVVEALTLSAGKHEDQRDQREDGNAFDQPPDQFVFYRSAFIVFMKGSIRIDPAPAG